MIEINLGVDIEEVKSDVTKILSSYEGRINSRITRDAMATEIYNYFESQPWYHEVKDLTIGMLVARMIGECIKQFKAQANG